MTTTKIINVPTSVNDPQMRVLLQQLRENAMMAPSAADLQAVLLEARRLVDPPLPPGAYAPPGPITNLTTHGMFGGVMLLWDTVFSGVTVQPGIAFVEVWRNSVDDRSTAVLRMTVDWDMALDIMEAGETYYYWVRGVSSGGSYGPFNDTAGTPGTAVIPPEQILDQLVGEITESQLHADLNARIDLIDVTGGGLVAATEDNATDILTEAAARLSLAQQLRGDYTGSDLNSVTTGLIHQERVSTQLGLDQLASQMALLSAGSASQFDHAELWYFDTGVESWTGVGGTPATPNPGFVRVDGAPYMIVSPTIAIDGTKFTQVRFRIKKYGTGGSWDGLVQYITTVDASWGTSGKSVVVDAPTFDGDIANVTVNMDAATWTGKTITNIRIHLANGLGGANYYDVDWVAIGRPAPGASSAELFTEQLARISGDNANASDIVIANAAIAGKASQASVTTLTSRVTTAENTLVTQGSSIVGLQGSVGANQFMINPNFANWVNPASYPDNWSSWAGYGMSQHTGAYAYSGGKALQFITASTENSGTVQNVYDANSQFIDFELTFTLISGSLSGAGIHVYWNNTVGGTFWTEVILKDLYTPADIYGRKIVCKARLKRPAGFTGTFSHYTIYLMGNYGGSSLGSLSVKNIIYDTIRASVADASASAIQALDTRVTSAEGTLTSQSSSLTTLRNSIALGTNCLTTSTWTPGTSGNQGTSGQQGYYLQNGDSGENRIVIGGNSGVPFGPFGGSDIMWECQADSDGNDSGGYDVKLQPSNKISKYRGAVFAVFLRHDGITNGNFYHGGDLNNGLVTMAGAVDGNPYFSAISATSLTPNRWYLFYGIMHPLGSTGADTGLSGVYDCTTGVRVSDGTEYRLADAWDSSPQGFRNYLYYSNDTAHKCWFTKPFVSPLDNAPTPQMLMGLDPRTEANVAAISALNTSVSSINGTLISQGTAITSLNSQITGKADASAVTTLTTRVDNVEGVNSAQATAISQVVASLPGGGNLLPNTDFRANTNGWSFWNGGGGTTNSGRNFAGTNWVPIGRNQIGMNRIGAQTGDMDITSNSVPITPGTRYCFGANIAGHRCTLRMFIVWRDSNGVGISNVSAGNFTQTGGNNLATGWPRQGVFGTAPANAYYAAVVLRGQDIGDADEYIWLCEPMLSEVPANTTVVPRYTSSVAGAYAAVSEEASVRISETGAIMAQKFLKFDVNGKVAGWGAMNDGIQSAMEFAFDRVSFYAPGAQSFSMILDGNKVVIDGASIKTATITDAVIQSLNVTKLIGDSANFVKLNVGTLVVDDIQGNISDVYALGPITSAFDFGGSSTGSGDPAGNQVSVGFINTPARINGRPYGLQFFVQGTATKGTAGTGNIVADFLQSNPSSSVIGTITIPGNFQNSGTAFVCVNQATNTVPSSGPADWANATVGEALTLFLDGSNYVEGRLKEKVAVSETYNVAPGTVVYVRGTVLVLDKIVKIGTVPSNGSGCVLQRRNTSGRLYIPLGITISTTVYAPAANTEIRYSMAYYDTGARTGSARAVLCTIGHVGTGTCVNKSVDFAILAGR